MNQRCSRRIHLLLVFLLTVTCFSGQVVAQVSEYFVKAAFLERFSRFVEWPTGSDIDDPDSPFVIAIIGKNPFGSTLENLYASQKIRNKEVTIKYINDPEEISACHLLFISNSWKKELGRIISVTRDRPILTVGDTKGFASQNVHINLYAESEEYPFEINVKAAREAGLDIDYHLLELARIVE